MAPEAIGSIQDLAHWNNLTSSEINALKEIKSRIDNGEKKITLREVAAASYMSNSGIVRLAKKLGFEGFQHLVYSLSDSAKSPSVSNGLGGLVRGMVGAEGLAAARHLVDDVMSGSYQKIHCIGLGFSALVSQHLCERLQEMDLWADNKSPLDFETTAPSIVIFVSESGETNDEVFINERSRGFGCRTYAVTANGTSSLARGVDEPIVILNVAEGRRMPGTPDIFHGEALIVCETIVATLRAARKARKEEGDD